MRLVGSCVKSHARPAKNTAAARARRPSWEGCPGTRCSGRGPAGRAGRAGPKATGVSWQPCSRRRPAQQVRHLGEGARLAPDPRVARPGAHGHIPAGSRLAARKRKPRKSSAGNPAAVREPGAGIPPLHPRSPRAESPRLQAEATSPLTTRPGSQPARASTENRPGLTLPAGSEGQLEEMRRGRWRWRVGVKPLGKQRCKCPALPDAAHLGRRDPGSGLRSLLCGAEAAAAEGAGAAGAGLLRRHRGLQLQWRRRPPGASPYPDSRRWGPPPPAAAGPTHVTAGPTLHLPHPGPRGPAAPRASGCRGRGAALRGVGRGPGSGRSGQEGGSRRRKGPPLC